MLISHVSHCCLFTFPADVSAFISMTRDQRRDESVRWLMETEEDGVGAGGGGVDRHEALGELETIFLVSCFRLLLPSIKGSNHLCQLLIQPEL